MTRKVHIVSRTVLALIRFYQFSLSPLKGRTCRFYPSCSEYAKGCYLKFPAIKATQKTLFRIGKCHPWHPGGVDYP